MANAKPFLVQTAETAWFAFQEFFRPLLVMITFLKGGRAAPKRAELIPKCYSPEDGHSDPVSKAGQGQVQ